MPRRPRVHSHSNIYHVCLRGINQQQIFYDKEDYRYFLKVLEKYKEPSGYMIHAYCLMGNHIHLLIQTGAESLETVFKRIGASFVYWYNSKYERSGHLFQDRFHSEPVDDENYYRVVFRYILQNPVKAGLCKDISEYKYSSAVEYVQWTYGITDTDFARNLFGNDMETYIFLDNDDECLDVKENRRKSTTDSAAMQLILREFKELPPIIGRPVERKSFNEKIRKIYKSGVSVRQISRLMGVSRSIITRGLED